jgi:dienelactone hydrolase
MVVAPAIAALTILLAAPAAAEATAGAKPAPAPAVAVPDLRGDWSGTWMLGRSWRFIRMRSGSDTSEARLDVPADDETNLALKVTRRSSSVRLAADLEGGTRIEFEGTAGGNEIRGTVRLGASRGPFQLVRGEPATREAIQAVIANYRFEDGRVASVHPFDPGDGTTQLAYFDDTGLWGVLLDHPRGGWVFAPARHLPFTASLRVMVGARHGPLVTELSLGSGAGERRALRIAPFREDSVRFANGDVRLAGSVLSPADSLRHPGIVIVHGSGAQARNGSASSPNYLRFTAEHFARRGFVVLLYDKRGVGESSGSWNRASFDDLAADALAALRALEKRSDVDPKRTGMWGISQGGWVIASAASRSRDLDFVIPVGGGGVGTVRQELYRRELNLREAGFTPAEIAEAMEHQNLKFELVRRNQPERLDAVNREAAGRKWFSFVSNPTRGDSWTYWRGVIDVDPAAWWRKASAPVLVVFGEHDESGPAREAVDNIAAARAGHPFTGRIFDGADHMLMVPPAAPGEFPRFAPGYLDLIASWPRETPAAGH